MARQNDLPFDRGSTFFGGGTPSLTDGVNLEGKEYLVEDLTNGTGQYVRLRATRNRSGFALAPKRLVSVGGNNLPGQVAGYAATGPQYVAGVVDDQYASTIADSDIFWMVVEGPVLVKTPMDAAADNVINVSDFLVNTSGTTTGATTGGRAKTVDLSGATSPLGNNILDTWGRALSAATTANTNSDLLVNVTKRD